MAAAARVAIAAATLAAPVKSEDELASRLPVAPLVAPDHIRLVQLTVNGIAFGDQLARIAGGRIVLPAAALRAIGLSDVADRLDLAAEPDIGTVFDAAHGTLALTIPAQRFAARHLASDDAAAGAISPETWGAYVNYDINFRHEFALPSGHNDTGFTGDAPRGRSGLGAFGGFADVRLLAPDLIGGFAFAYDSLNGRGGALIRLDSVVTWRPSRLDLAVSAGDIVLAASVALARTYRFGGLQIGTDFSGTPGWTSAPTRSVSGTAQVQSNIDVYLNGQRTFHGETPGGAFSLALPPGSTGAGTSIVVTDVSGRAVMLPIEVAPIDPQMIRRGLMLWSAGAGVPRFAFGAATSSYDHHAYAYANVRYGVADRLTATTHVEAGAGLFELESGGMVAVGSALGIRSTVAVSRAAAGVGGAGSGSVTLAGPWQLAFEGTVRRTFGHFADVVSASGSAYARRGGLDVAYSLPPRSEIAGRLAWQLRPALSLSASYQQNSYTGSPSFGFVAAGASYLFRGRIPMFLNLSHATGRQRSSAVLFGASFQFGKVQVSATAGRQDSGSAATQNGFVGNLDVSKALGQASGDVGWNVFTNRSPVASFVAADIQARTGYGIPGAAVQSFGSVLTAFATLRGSFGIVGLHPFLADPVMSGIIIADVGRPGIPVELNGFSQGRTSFDGKLAMTSAVAGTPQRIEIDAEQLAIDLVPSATNGAVTVRDGGAAVLRFGVEATSASALLNVTVDGAPPPLGSTITGKQASAPISKEGRAYLTSLNRNEVLTVEMPDGRSCRVDTHFDGHGGVGRRIGSFACEALAW